MILNFHLMQYCWFEYADLISDKSLVILNKFYDFKNCAEK